MVNGHAKYYVVLQSNSFRASPRFHSPRKNQSPHFTGPRFPFSHSSNEPVVGWKNDLEIAALRRSHGNSNRNSAAIRKRRNSFMRKEKTFSNRNKNGWFAHGSRRNQSPTIRNPRRAPRRVPNPLNSKPHTLHHKFLHPPSPCTTPMFVGATTKAGYTRILDRSARESNITLSA
jgi:hypothetical protein